jgi:hypothetical protein
LDLGKQERIPEMSAISLGTEDRKILAGKK